MTAQLQASTRRTKHRDVVVRLDDAHPRPVHDALRHLPLVILGIILLLRFREPTHPKQQIPTRQVQVPVVGQLVVDVDLSQQRVQVEVGGLVCLVYIALAAVVLGLLGGGES